MKPPRSERLTAKPTPHGRFASPRTDEGRSNRATSDGSERGVSPVRSWVRFWFTPLDPIGLHVLRLVTGSLLLAWLLLTFAGNLESLVGLQGWVDSRAFGDAARLAESLQLPKEQAPFVPSWSVLYWCQTSTALVIAFWASVAVVALFVLGVCPRLTGVLTWIVVASFTANPALEYEGDLLLLILSFYLMAGYLLLGLRTPGLSWPKRLVGPLLVWPLGATGLDDDGGPKPSIAANVTLRLVQVHFALVIFTSGLHKLQFGDWWAGVALWFPLHPPFKTTLAEAMANKPHADVYLSMLNIATYATLAWQIGFPLFAWRPRWRPVLIGGAAIGWLGTAFLWNLPVIGPAIFIGCLSFVSPAGWHRILGWLPKFRSQESGVRSQEPGARSTQSVGAVS